MKRTFHLTNAAFLPELMEILRQAAATGEHVIEIRKRTRQRTPTQNRCLHAYCEMIAEMMRDAGTDQRALTGKFKEGFTIPVQGHMIKDIFRAVGLAMYKKKSTSDLTTVEIQEVHKIIDQRLGEVTGVSCAWPSYEPPIFKGEVC